MPRIDWNAITIGDETKSLTEWCLQTGTDRETAYKRINDHGWPEAQAVGLEPRVRDGWAKNTRFQHRRDVLVTYKGQARTLKDWHEITKTWERPIPYRTLVYRYNHGYEGDDLFDIRNQSRSVRKDKADKKREKLEREIRKREKLEREKHILDLTRRITGGRRSR